LGGLPEKQALATCDVTAISACAATQKPTGVQIAGRSVGRSQALPGAYGHVASNSQAYKL